MKDWPPSGITLLLETKKDNSFVVKTILIRQKADADFEESFHQRLRATKKNWHEKSKK
ncbi:hypothetical protein [Candidatus Protochlamydia sp. W-9]|uniref:hypothetical protein n=1 Tax=Candidatus Protochlamydia sp. W-9 TaxID=1785087 RepID=UPI001301149F|nr:hypothetical protein [Candidatus Protochlamydia sp. W-9]